MGGVKTGKMKNLGFMWRRIKAWLILPTPTPQLPAPMLLAKLRLCAMLHYIKIHRKIGHSVLLILMSWGA